MKFIIIAVLGLSLTATTLSLTEPTNVLESTTALQFAKMNGISETVYNCALDVLKDKDAEALITFISEEAETAGTPQETLKANQLKQCIYKDPFGWAGTENEWAISLLNTEDWK